MALDCLQNIVGVTTSQNACITQGLTSEQLEELKKSTSGIYLDDLPGGVHMSALKNADSTKSFYDMATGALKNAAKTLEDGLITELNKNYSSAKKSFIGQVGRMSFASTLATSGTWQGIRLRPLDAGDLVGILTKITLIVNTTVSHNVYLYRVGYKTNSRELIKTWPINSAANVYVSIFPEGGEVRLPFKISGELYEYWILWDRAEAGGALPKDNTLECSTCGSGPRLGHFIDAAGVQFNDLDAMQNATADNYGHGLTLDISFKCDTAGLFCGQYRADEAVAVTMARMIWYKAGELLIEEVLKSPDLNRYTTMDRERLWGKRNHYRAEYDNRMNYLANVIDVTASNCYVCRETANQPFYAGIFS